MWLDSGSLEMSTEVFSERFREEKHALNMGGALPVAAGPEWIKAAAQISVSIPIALLPDVPRCEWVGPTVQLRAAPTTLLSLIQWAGHCGLKRISLLPNHSLAGVWSQQWASGSFGHQQKLRGYSLQEVRCQSDSHHTLQIEMGRGQKWSRTEDRSSVMGATLQAERQFRKTLSDHLAGKRLESDYRWCVAITMDSGGRA